MIAFLRVVLTGTEPRHASYLSIKAVIVCHLLPPVNTVLTSHVHHTLSSTRVDNSSAASSLTIASKMSDEEVWATAFKAFDRDESGRIDVDELSKVLKSLYEGKGDEECMSDAQVRQSTCDVTLS